MVDGDRRLEVVRYRRGRRMWHFPGERTGRVAVLLWHGSGALESDVLAPLAAAVAARGPDVLVPDWRFDDADHGRADLLASLEWALARASQLVIAGWSMGAAAATGVVLSMPEVPLRAVVLLAGATAGREPITGEPIADRVPRWPPSVPCTLVHGVDDEIVPVTESRDFVAALGRAQVPATLHEVPGRHASVVLTAYDHRVERCLPDDGPAATAAGSVAVDSIVAACATGDAGTGPQERGTGRGQLTR